MISYTTINIPFYMFLVNRMYFILDDITTFSTQCTKPCTALPLQDSASEYSAPKRRADTSFRQSASYLRINEKSVRFLHHTLFCLFGCFLNQFIVKRDGFFLGGSVDGDYAVLCEKHHAGIGTDVAVA